MYIATLCICINLHIDKFQSILIHDCDQHEKKMLKKFESDHNKIYSVYTTYSSTTLLMISLSCSIWRFSFVHITGTQCLTSGYPNTQCNNPALTSCFFSKFQSKYLQIVTFTIMGDVFLLHLGTKK